MQFFLKEFFFARTHDAASRNEDVRSSHARKLRFEFCEKSYRRTDERRKSDRIHIFIYRDLCDLSHGAVKSHIDDLGPKFTKKMRENTKPPRVSVKPALCDKNSHWPSEMKTVRYLPNIHPGACCLDLGFAVTPPRALQGLRDLAHRRIDLHRGDEFPHPIFFLSLAPPPPALPTHPPPPLDPPPPGDGVPRPSSPRPPPHHHPKKGPGAARKNHDA